MEVQDAVELSRFKIDMVISGTARGGDRLGEQWAENNNVPIERFPADWDTYGKSAGYKRNEDMARNADAVILLWDGKSKGTAHMLDIAKEQGLLYYVYYIHP